MAKYRPVHDPQHQPQGLIPRRFLEVEAEATLDDLRSKGIARESSIRALAVSKLWEQLVMLFFLMISLGGFTEQKQILDLIDRWNLYGIEFPFYWILFASLLGLNGLTQLLLYNLRSQGRWLQVIASISMLILVLIVIGMQVQSQNNAQLGPGVLCCFLMGLPAFLSLFVLLSPPSGVIFGEEYVRTVKDQKRPTKYLPLIMIKAGLFAPAWLAGAFGIWLLLQL
ncbi:Hypothetical protein PBC10988_40040 [Planctomycetales bacterium 10988]|nr:Hypothetical protein PBC10988_40040 [Planctomycetales bacterium 10988]